MQTKWILYEQITAFTALLISITRIVLYDMSLWSLDFCASWCEGCLIVQLKIKRIGREILWVMKVCADAKISTCSFRCYIHSCSRKVLSRGVKWISSLQPSYFSALYFNTLSRDYKWMVQDLNGKQILSAQWFCF